MGRSNLNSYIWLRSLSFGDSHVVCYHGSSDSEIFQPDSAILCFYLKVEFSDSTGKNTFASNLSIKITRNNFDVIARTDVIC